METDTVQGALNSAFRVALLFGCDPPAAEAAVLDGIGACEEVALRSLLIETVGSSLRRRAISVDAPSAVRLLPAELRPLFKLNPLLRDCFVLRILLGLSPEACTGLLKISGTEFEDAFYAALQQLPLSPNVDSRDNQRPPMRAIGRNQTG